MKPIQLIYPETYRVTWEEVESMFDDAVANGEIDGIDATCDSPSEMLDALESAGIVTVARGPREPGSVEQADRFDDERQP